jgi:hypothetical protein
MDDETLDGTVSSRPKSRTRRLLGRSRSPKGSGSEPDVSPKRRTSRSGSVSSSSFSREQSPAVDEAYDACEMVSEKRDMDESEWDLTMRLELARHNSQNQGSRGPVEPLWDRPVEDTIYEGCYLFDVSCIILNMPIDNPPEPLRPSSRASGSGLSQRSTTPTNLFFPTPLTEVNERPESAAPRNASGSRPRGPRSPSPLPPSPRASPGPDFEALESALETTLHNLHRAATAPGSKPAIPPILIPGHISTGSNTLTDELLCFSPSPGASPRVNSAHTPGGDAKDYFTMNPSPCRDFQPLPSPHPLPQSLLPQSVVPPLPLPVTPPKSVSPLPRSRRQPFEPTGNTEAALGINSHSVQKTPGAIEPLSIKKKISLRNSAGESPSRKAHLRTPPSIRGRVVSPRRVSPIVRQKKTTASSGSHEDVDLPKLVRLVESLKDEVESTSLRIILASLTVS